MKKAVISLVQRHDQAEAIVSQLQNVGFSPGDISVLFPDKSGTADFAHEHNTKAPEGAVAGAGGGGVIGGTIGLLAGLGALAIPGLGPFIAAGPLLATLGGAAVGAGVGGLTGALVGMGIPELEAKKYEGKIKGGNLLVAVSTDTPEERKRAEEVFKSFAADDVSTVGEASVPRAADSVR
ncbi:MAG: Succinyl-CoA ligase [ADP-forming] beta chain [Labilithrix sp.]|nr:Succinyl-CoA ligase [ADP-forming] beta chain [Labilithrix sp.]